MSSPQASNFSVNIFSNLRDKKASLTALFFARFSILEPDEPSRGHRMPFFRENLFTLTLKGPTFAPYESTWKTYSR